MLKAVLDWVAGHKKIVGVIVVVLLALAFYFGDAVVGGDADGAELPVYEGLATNGICPTKEAAVSVASQPTLEDAKDMAIGQGCMRIPTVDIFVTKFYDTPIYGWAGNSYVVQFTVIKGSDGYIYWLVPERIARKLRDFFDGV